MRDGGCQYKWGRLELAKPGGIRGKKEEWFNRTLAYTQAPRNSSASQGVGGQTWSRLSLTLEPHSIRRELIPVGCPLTSPPPPHAHCSIPHICVCT